MKKIGLVFCLVLFLSVSFQVSAQWSDISPWPKERTLNSVYFITESIGFIVDQSGLIQKSTEQGEFWNIVKYNSEYGLNDIYFTDLNTGFAMNEIKFTTVLKGFCVGDKGTILKTSDGGNSWSNISDSIYSNLNSLYFIDSDFGYAVGDSGLVIRTTNSGTDWEVVQFDSVIDFNSIHFTNSFTGYIVGEKGTVFKTTDAGFSWILKLYNTQETNFNSVYFSNINTGFAVGTNGRIHITRDSGNLWQLRNAPSVPSFKTINFPDSLVGYVTGEQGLIIKTTDGGLSWKILKSDLEINFRTSFFINKNIGYLGGPNGKVIKTSDGGNTWSFLDLGSYQDVYSLFFSSSQIGYAGLQGNWIYKTTDAGSSWFSIPVINTVMSIYFLDTENGYVGCNSNNIGKTTDGGINWTWSYTNVFPVLSMYFLNVNTGFAVGSPGNFIMKTVNGGASWDYINTNMNDWQNQISFASNTIGYSVGGGGLLKTTDAGYSWAHEINNRVFYAVDAPNVNTAYFCGFQGVIYKFDKNDSTTSAQEQILNSIPKQFLLQQNYPNPFNPSTSIQYAISSTQFVTLKVYDLLGREVATLVNEEKPAGSYNAQFTINNVQLSSGIYFYKLQAGDFVETKKMILLK
jgi:photosystem II stability/assembly factor-like uncharacterized protein